MTTSAEAKSDVPLEASIPVGAVPLETILRTEELRRRPWRAPDYKKENAALVALSRALAESQREMLRAGGRYAHPYYWAPFVLVGEMK